MSKITLDIAKTIPVKVYSLGYFDGDAETGRELGFIPVSDVSDDLKAILEEKGFNYDYDTDATLYNEGNSWMLILKKGATTCIFKQPISDHDGNPICLSDPQETQDLTLDLDTNSYIISQLISGLTDDNSLEIKDNKVTFEIKESPFLDCNWQPILEKFMSKETKELQDEIDSCGDMFDLLFGENCNKINRLIDKCCKEYLRLDKLFEYFNNSTFLLEVDNLGSISKLIGPLSETETAELIQEESLVINNNL